MLNKIIIGLVAVIAAFAVIVALQPAEYHVERSKEIKASPDIVWTHISDFGKWKAWSPWEKGDPTQKTTESGQPGTVGHKSTWVGEQTGKGTMSIVKADKPNQLDTTLVFEEPMSGTANASFILKPAKESVTVTWTLDGKNDFVGKLFSLVMNMDEMLGSQYETGLASLATLSEADAKKQAEEAAAREAAAQAAAAAAAEAPDAAVVK